MLEHKKDFLTFEELRNRWDIDERNLRRLIVTEKLIPSFLVNEYLHKVRFEIGENLGWKPIPLVRDNIENNRNDLFFAYGFYYLKHPFLTSSLDCLFYFFSDDKNHQKGGGEHNQCFHVSTYSDNPYSRGIPLDVVLVHGVVMMEEVEHYERMNLVSEKQINEKSDFIEWPWGTHTTEMLNVLAATAKKWWINFDKDDITTAPKKYEVVKWIVDNYGVSKNQASIIASILRPEDIRTGPR